MASAYAAKAKSTSRQEFKQLSSSGMWDHIHAMELLYMRHSTEIHIQKHRIQFKDQITRFLSVSVILLESRAFAYLHFFRADQNLTWSHIGINPNQHA